MANIYDTADETDEADATGESDLYDESDRAQGFRPGTHERALSPEEGASYANRTPAGESQPPAGPLPPGGTEATVRNGRFYDPSGREVASIGETPQQAAERFGAQLPMSQRELQQLDQKRQSYNQVLNDPNLPGPAKYKLLNALAREIHFGQTRLQYMQAEQRMQMRQAQQAQVEDGISAKSQLSAHNLAMSNADVAHIAANVKALEAAHPDKEVTWNQRHGYELKPKAAPKGSPDDGTKERQQVWDLASRDYQKRLKDWNTAGKKGNEPQFNESLQQAETDQARRKLYSHGPAGPAAGSADAGSANPGPSPGQPMTIDQKLAAQEAIGKSHQADQQKLQQIARPEEREAKMSALTRSNTLLAQYVGRPVPPEVQQELRRLKTVLTQKWPAERPQTLGQQEGGIDFSGGM